MKIGKEDNIWFITPLISFEFKQEEYVFTLAWLRHSITLSFHT